MVFFKKTFLILFFILVSFSTWSQTAPATSNAAVEDDIKQILTAERRSNDDFHTILAEMWGGFIFSDPNGQPTLLSEVVGYTNVLALILGIIIVTYVSLAAVINSASSGEVLGRQWSTYWLPIRTAMAFGLLVPTQVGAFALSTAQVIVIKLVIMASTSASFLWERAVDRALMVNRSSPNLILPYKLAYDSSVSLSCSVVLARDSNFGEPSVIKVSYLDGSVIDITEQNAEKMSTLSSKIDELKVNILAPALGSTTLTTLNYITKISFWSGKCGQISFSIPDFSTTASTSFTAALKDELNALKSSVNITPSASVRDASLSAAMALKDYQMHYINFLSQYAKEVITDNKQRPTRRNSSSSQRVFNYNRAINYSFDNVSLEFYLKLNSPDEMFSLFSNGTGQDSVMDGTSEKVLARVIAYKRTVNTFINNVSNIYNVVDPLSQSRDLSQAKARELLTKGGWIYAGAFFYKISQLEGLANKSSSAMISGGASVSRLDCKDCHSAEDLLASTELVSAMYKHAFMLDINLGLNNDINPVPPESLVVPLITASQEIALNRSVIDSAFSRYAVDALAGLGGVSVFGRGGNLNQDESFEEMTKDNPFQFAANIGHGMNNLKYLVYIAKGLANTLKFGSETTANNPVVGMATIIHTSVFRAVLTSLIELLSISLVLLTAMSWILAYYIPMMPALLWITLIGAYILIVIEAVVATPLAVVLMATPEGEGISGSKMQNAITLIASVFLRPSLMIIGLIAAIYVAKYSFIILNIVFWTQAESSVRSDLFGFFAVFALYITSLHQVLSNSIKSMDSLPTAILNWIGQGANAQFGQNEISGAGDQLSQKEAAFGKAGDGFKKAFEKK